MKININENDGIALTKDISDPSIEYTSILDNVNTGDTMQNSM